jgi:hypothetical protein
MPNTREVKGTASEIVLLWVSDANSKGRNRYCIRVSAVVGTEMPTVREGTDTASDVVRLWVQ